MQRREDAKLAGIADESVEPAPAPIDRLAEPVDRRAVLEVHRNQRRRLARSGTQGLDRVVEFLQRALGAREPIT